MNMVKRKRTVLALLLALCMIVMLLPVTVFAEGENGAASVTDNLNGEGVIAGETMNGGADAQTVGAAAKDVTDNPEGSAAKNATDKPDNGTTDKPEGIVVKGVATRGVTDQPGGGEITPTYKHTYHTKVISIFTIHYQGQSAQEPESITLESGFNVGNISDPAIQGIIANQKQEMKSKIRSGYVVKDSDISQPETKLEFDHFESSNIIDFNPDGDGSSVNKNLDVHEYQNYTINYDVYASYADIEDGIINKIRIDNAKLTFKPGEAPIFTAKVADGYGMLYTLYCQDWSLGSWKDNNLRVHASNDPADYDFKAFEKDKTYKYSLFVKLTDRAKEDRLQFADNVELILNGKTITGLGRSLDENRSSVDFYDVAEMTPTEEIAPDPANTDQGKVSNTAAKTESKGKTTDSSAKTGDDANPMLWAGILLLAAAGAGAAVFYRRKADH